MIDRNKSWFIFTFSAGWDTYGKYPITMLLSTCSAFLMGTKSDRFCVPWFPGQVVWCFGSLGFNIHSLHVLWQHVLKNKRMAFGNVLAIMKAHLFPVCWSYLPVAYYTQWPVLVVPGRFGHCYITSLGHCSYVYSGLSQAGTRCLNHNSMWGFLD